jgi:AcrR family transcriptional regulator
MDTISAASSISAAVQMLGDLADDEALSLRAVARAVSISPTSVCLYFPDRDSLVLAAMQHCHEDMLRTADESPRPVIRPPSRSTSGPP